MQCEVIRYTDAAPVGSHPPLPCAACGSDLLPHEDLHLHGEARSHYQFPLHARCCVIHNTRSQ